MALRRFILAALIASGWSGGLWAREVPFYVSTCPYSSKAIGKGIYRGTLDVDTGALGPLVLAAEAPSPTFLAMAPDGRFLYAALNRAGGGFAAYRVDPQGGLELINRAPFDQAGSAVHLTVDATGRYLLAASWGGIVAAFRLGGDGSILTPAVSSYTFAGCGPARYQEAAHPHAIYADPSNQFVYACALGADSIGVFKFDARTGSLTPVLPFALMPAGSGPRHLAFGVGGKTVYVNGQMGRMVGVFSRDTATGALKLIQTLSTLPPGAEPPKDADTSEIMSHPSGHWLYVGNRTHDSLTVYRINAADGRLEWVENVPSGIKSPVNFAFDPTGRWLVVAGQTDTRIAVFGVDPATGRLTGPRTVPLDDSGPACVVF